MPPSGKAVAAAPANNVPFGADDIAGVKIRNVGSNLDDLAYEFMPHDQRHGNRPLRPCIPFINVKVCAAYSGTVHTDKNIVDAHFRFGYVFEPQTRFRLFFYQCFHDRSVLLQ
jgi:hypothetical protein